MFYYTVKYWDNDEQKNIHESGLVGAASYSEAAERLTTYFGRGLSSMELTEWETVLCEEEILDGFSHEVEED